MNSSFYVSIRLDLLPCSSKSYLSGTNNANYRKKMRTRFCLCYNMIQTQVTVKYPQERRVLKNRNPNIMRQYNKYIAY